MNAENDSTYSMPRIEARCWGDPLSPATYSGLPSAIFGRYRDLGLLASARSLRPGVWSSLVRRRFSIPHILRRERWANPLWRYSRIGRREVQRLLRAVSEDADLVFQFGVAGQSSIGRPVLCHVEIPIRHALEDPNYSRGYRLGSVDSAVIAELEESELDFLLGCSVIWTNSDYTASLFPDIVKQKLRIVTPGCKISIPEKDWNTDSEPLVLFVGRNWELKGGPLLVNAMNVLHRRGCRARLAVVGCSPRLDSENVYVLGLLRMDRPDERSRFESLFAEASVFCMPSHWESTGMVFMEAACAGIPTVMLKIPETDGIFSDEYFDKLASPDPEALADILEPFLRDNEAAADRGRKLAAYARQRFGPAAFYSQIDALAVEAASVRTP